MKIVNIKTKIISGNGSLSSLQQIKGKRVCIICDGFMVASKIIDKVLEHIDESNLVKIFSEIVPDPTLDVVSKGLSIFIKQNPDIVIGFGGGSAIDTAKAILYFAKLNKSLDKKVKLIAIPTTSGTGSEVTSVTVITDKSENVKHAIFNDFVLPDEAILDPVLTLSVPKKITAYTGLDVLTHILEAYVAKNANSYSDALSEKAMELLIQSLVVCFLDGNNIEAREKMQEASNLAGTAFNIAGLGINHSIAHQLGALFHIPHGLANSIMLNHVLRYNATDSSVKTKYAKLAVKTGLTTKDTDENLAFEILLGYIISIKKIMDVPTNLKECGIKKNDFLDNLDIIIKNSLKDNCTMFNPSNVTKNSLKILLNGIYE